MKLFILILICLSSTFAMAQKLPDYGFNKVRIIEPDREIVACIALSPKSSPAKPALFYYWYSANGIHTSQGGSSGNLLDGPYHEYYPDKGLKEQGSFKNGLKDGTWKSWDRQGKLLTEIKWRRGAEVSMHPVPLWKRVHLFRKKGIAKDTVNTAKNPPVNPSPNTQH